MKSLFQFSNQQRQGIFSLLIVIIVAQCIYLFVAFPSKDIVSVKDHTLQKYQAHIDSLKKIASQKNSPKIFPFNPNFITDYKGYTLGMSVEEIDRLHRFRSKDQWVNSVKEFQRVTKVSDSLLKTIAPYFKFPNWINKSPKLTKTTIHKPSETKNFAQKQDLNTASALQLQSINGIGETLSKRIVSYRTKHNGFIADVELSEIYGLKPDVIQRIVQQFTVKTPRKLKTLHLNTATRDALVTVPYLDYENIKHIIEERTLRGGFSTFEELTKVEDFPINKLEIIKLYLHL